MAFTHGSKAKFYLADSAGTERDISSSLTDVQVPKTADTSETSALGDVAKQYIPGLKDSTLSLSGTRDATHEGYIDGVVGTLAAWAYCPEGSATGKVKFSGTAIITDYTPSSSVSAASSYTVSGQGSGTVTKVTL